MLSKKQEQTTMHDFKLSDVLVTDEYYSKSYDLEVLYLTSLDLDKLLAGFRETAAYASNMTLNEVTIYMKNSERYAGDWENALIGGHTLGHYMTAVAQAYANPATTDKDKIQLETILTEIITSLHDCQEKTKNSKLCSYGYLFGAELLTYKDTNLEYQFDNVESGKANIFTQAWVPWYTMHKILSGLVNIYKITDNKLALTIAQNLGEWIYNRTSSWSDSTKATVLSIEYGGMNDCLYELYMISKTSEYKNSKHFLDAAHIFDEEPLFTLVHNNTKNALNAKHANTTIPKFLGALKRYIAIGDKPYLEYAQSFWDMVVNNHTYITGGNSEDEHFGSDKTLDVKRTNCNCETCNTYNMLKLSRELFKITGDVKYADYYENTLINAIMASQNHETGMTMYFQPMATGYHKVYSTATKNFWCCTGSGMENFSKLNDSIYFHKKNLLVINQYISSELTWENQNIKIIQTSGIQTCTSNTATFDIQALDTDKPFDINLKLRIPDWTNGDISVTLNGKTYEYTKSAINYITISDITKASTVLITIPMCVKAYSLPDNKDVYAFKYGSCVLSACLGMVNQETVNHGVNVTVPSQSAVENDNILITACDTIEEYTKNISKYLIKDNDNLSFTLKGATVNYTFIPHYLQTESYGIYFKLLTFS